MAKHFFYLAAVGALALTACTQQDVVDDVTTTRNVIKFENVVNKPSRAAKDLTTADLLQFNVYGFYTMPDNDKHANEVFKNVPVTKNNAVWSYDDKYVRYWVPGATYYFYAYSCGSVSALSESYGTFNLDMSNEDGGKLASDRTLEIDNYICDNKHQHDLIFASNTGIEATATGNPTVSFQFKHILSKIKASFSSKFSPEYDVIISDVSVNNICNKGDYDFKDGWTNVTRIEGQQPLVYLLNTTGDGIKEEDKDAEISVKNEMIENKQATVDSKAAFVMPMAYTDTEVTLSFHVVVKYGEDTIIPDTQLTATFKPEWKQGYYYIYNIAVSPEDLNLGEIKFDVKIIEGWDDGESTDLEIDKPKE